MNNTGYIAGLNALLSLSSGMQAAAAPVREAARPNIILILIDDMGYPALSCYGNKIVKTTNIDGLAAQGMRFTNGYVAPQSTPTRACLLTGCYGTSNRMWHVIPYYGFPYARVREPEFIENLPREEYTLAEAVKAAGYKTACIGKWHLSTPDNDGYYTYLYPDKAHFYGFDYVNPTTNPSEYQSYGDKGVDFLTDEAIGFIERNADSPFFIYLSHHTIHNPVLAPSDLVEKYRRAGYPESGLSNATYLAALEHLDNSVGRLLARLEALGLDEKTIVFFISDNGGVDSQFDNFPLRYGKGSAYEGGIRVPYIVKWPGVIKPGSVQSLPVHIVDIYPTLLDITGSAKPPGKKLDGISLVPVFERNSKYIRNAAERPIYFYQPLYDIQWGATPSAAIIKDGYKLIQFFGDYIDLDEGGKYIPEARTELYNLTEDTGEFKDISEIKTELKDKMLRSLYDWIRSQKADIPALNPSFNIDRWNERSNIRQ